MGVKIRKSVFDILEKQFNVEVKIDDVICSEEAAEFILKLIPKELGVFETVYHAKLIFSENDKPLLIIFPEIENKPLKELTKIYKYNNGYFAEVGADF